MVSPSGARSQSLQFRRVVCRISILLCKAYLALLGDVVKRTKDRNLPFVFIRNYFTCLFHVFHISGVSFFLGHKLSSLVQGTSSPGVIACQKGWMCRPLAVEMSDIRTIYEYVLVRFNISIQYFKYFWCFLWCCRISERICLSVMRSIVPKLFAVCHLHGIVFRFLDT